ncbi:g5587 [Coccomyxa elongata]
MQTCGRHSIYRVPLYRGFFVRTFKTLPVVDIAALVKDDKESAAQLRAAKDLHAACRDVGFFYAVSHGVPASITDGVLLEARQWFNLPAHVKQEISLGPETCYRGYQQLGSNVTRFDGGFQRDHHEAIDLYKEESDRDASPLHGRNQWPVQRPSFDTSLQQYADACLGVGQAIMRGIALGLGLPGDYFESPEGGGTTAESSYWVMRAIHYPPLSQGEGQLGQAASQAVAGAEVERHVQLSCGEHTDYGLLTLVNQEPHIPALQVKNAAGEWITAAPIPGSFVCNIGDMLKVYTNGLYEPTAHRVINADPSRSRVSIPFFYEPAFEAQVAPIPALVPAGSAPNFGSVRYGTHLENKVLNNFELEPQASSVGEA